MTAGKVAGPSLRFDRRFPGVGRIHRSSGTRSGREFRARNAALSDLAVAGRYDVLRAFRDGSIDILDVLEATGWRDPAAPRALTSPNRQPRALTIYVVRAGEALKIGITSDISRRLKALRNASAHAVELLASFPGNRWMEEELHQRFATHRLRGEWFAAHPDLLAWVEEKKA